MKQPIDFEYVVNNIDEGVFTVDINYNITTFNKAMEDITGYTRDEALNAKCYQIINSTKCKDNGCALREVMDTGKSKYLGELTITCKNSRSVPIELTITPLFDCCGNVIGGMEIIADKSHLKSLYKEIHERYSFENIIGQNKKMQDIYSLVEAVAPTEASVLIAGESGTGKELVAKAIHYLSGRRYKPFVKVNCAALAENLLESELFGHERGSFTGALYKKKGRFELADKGTIFLDEITEIKPSLQAKLLRVLQEGEFERVGGTEVLKCDVRIIAATNRSIEREIANGNFRKDLYYRLNVFPISLPPLRERKNDIPLLVDHFIKKFNDKFSNPKKGIAPKALNFLMEYDFPGNVRELENAIEYAFVKAKRNYLNIEDLPLHITKEYGQENPLILSLEELEKQHIENVLKYCNGQKVKAAELLKITRKTLYNKMKKYNLN